MFWAFIGSIAVGLAAAYTIALMRQLVPVSARFAAPVAQVTFVAAFICAYYFFTRRFVKDLRRLGDGLAVIAQGNLQFRVPSARMDELGKVADDINGMAEHLELLIEKERQIEISKMELITGVSHDLRTPLTSIIGYLDLLHKRAYRDDSEYDRFVGNASNKAVQLKKLVDDLFEYTRLTTDDVKLKRETVDLRALLNQMQVEYEPIALELGVGVAAAFPSQPVFVRMDAEKVRRAVDNLLSNALKFSVKPGSVQMMLEADRTIARIVVANIGEPIAKEREILLFERFYKADDSRTSDAFPAGSGLGLSIARSIARLHGGEISFTHDAGRYAFAFELPLQGGT